MDVNLCELSDSLITKFEMFPNFYRPIEMPDKRITSIKFLPNGDNLVAATNKRVIELYNCNTGRQENLFKVYKHGISVMDVADSNDSILIGSLGVKGDYAVRELNMTKNKYTTCYFGHTAPSSSLAVNSEMDFFVSGGWDKSVLVFDFRIQSPQVSCRDLTSVPIVALHPTTQICAIAVDNCRIELNDLRFMNGPFCRFTMNADNVKWTHLKFSPNGDQLLISSINKIRVINSITGSIQDAFLSRKNAKNIPIDASFSPLSEYILSGSSDGNILVFMNSKRDQRQNILPEQKVVELKSYQPEEITAVEMSSKYSLMVSASSYVAFWAPNENLVDTKSI